MPRIHVLDPQVVNQIAAGEVIERPGSVVKELLENAVDAGATQIAIDVEDGGTELIRVVDNGSGITPDDLPLAFASHATSKLRSADDLAAIRTLGFRGEALASIGSVAQVTLQSRPAGANQGAEVACDGGVLGPVRAWNGQEGTRIEVRHLFFNTPARRKFLRTTATEMGHISESVTRLALGFPGLTIKLTHNGKTVYEVPASAALADRVRLFFGREVSDKLVEVNAAAGPVRLSGFVADPALDRGNARLQYLFVNGRWVRDRTLAHAVQEAYHGLLMTGRYAVAFLFLEVPPDQVDVNVHPTKAEVRFRDSQALHHFLLSAVRAKLRAGNLTPSARLPAPQSPAARFQPTPPQVHWSGPLPAWSPPTPAVMPTPPAPMANGTPIAAEPSVGPNDAHAATPPTAAPPPSAPQDLGPARALQVHNAYLVVETADGMLLIDQHALHERILYEQWKHRLAAGNVEVQRLLIPEPVDLTPDQAALALEHQAGLEQIGLGIQDFGHGTILVTSYPALLAKAVPAALLRRAVEYLGTAGKSPSAAQLLDDLLRLMSCHAAVKAGDPLSDDEINALLQYRDLVADTHHCPHGRPTSLYFSKHELDRQFQRV
jgi:DNA mismatch repair protein MutL